MKSHPQPSSPVWSLQSRLDLLALSIFLPLHLFLSMLFPSPEISPQPFGPFPSQILLDLLLFLQALPPLAAYLSLWRLWEGWGWGPTHMLNSSLSFSPQLNDSPIPSTHVLLCPLPPNSWHSPTDSSLHEPKITAWEVMEAATLPWFLITSPQAAAQRPRGRSGYHQD